VIPGGRHGQDFSESINYFINQAVCNYRLPFLYGSSYFAVTLNMKFFTLTIVISVFFISCKPSAVKQSFSTADSLVIHFKNEQAGIVTKTVQTTESKAINRVIKFMDAKETELYKCGYDGKMFFYTKGQQVQEVDFKMNDEACNHFAFLLNGKLVSTKMSNEAVDFFDALEKGMPYY
jgi:hypothetical protein